jgi:hypothetical protein
MNQFGCEHRPELYFCDRCIRRLICDVDHIVLDLKQPFWSASCSEQHEADSSTQHNPAATFSTLAPASPQHASSQCNPSDRTLHLDSSSSLHHFQMFYATQTLYACPPSEQVALPSKILRLSTKLGIEIGSHCQQYGIPRVEHSRLQLWSHLLFGKSNNRGQNVVA